MLKDETIIKVSDLHKSYDGATNVLNGVDLEIPRGGRVAIIGRSGCGKTTFLRCLACLELFDEGSIEIAGVSLTKRAVQNTSTKKKRLSGGLSYPFQEVERLEIVDEDFRDRVRLLRSRVGIVFQSLNLFPHLSVMDNVAKAPLIVKKMNKKAARDLSVTQLERVGMGKHLLKMPHQISGGQAQRVAIARALALNPQVMLFDEPTSSLDPELVGEFIAVMDTLSADGMTQLVVTHSMSFTRKASESVVYMEEGRVIEIGTPADMFSNPKDDRTRNYLQIIDN